MATTAMTAQLKKIENKKQKIKNHKSWYFSFFTLPSIKKEM